MGRKRLLAGEQGISNECSVAQDWSGLVEVVGKLGRVLDRVIAVEALQGFPDVAMQTRKTCG